MSHPHYYASTSRNLDRVLQYGVFPFAYMAGLLAFHTHEKATQFARFSGAAASSLLTTAFLGLESHTLDNVLREAVTAEMGIDVDQFKPSDCKYSQNVIAQEGYNDFIALQPKRYLKDALFLLPSAVEWAYKKSGAGKYRMKAEFGPPRRDVAGAFDERNKGKSYDPTKFNAADIIANGHVGWDMAIYMGISAYWAYETFLVEKNSYYPVAQDIVGKIKPTEGNIDFNHLMNIYQLARNDQKLPLIKADDGQAHAALKYLFSRIIDAYNKHDGKCDIPEIVYLLGLNKIRIHGDDGITISKDAILQSEREIEKVLTTGLDGIRAENKKLRESGQLTSNNPNLKENSYSQAHHSRPNFVNPEYRSRTFVDKVADTAIKTSQSILVSLGMLRHSPTGTPISSADPTELIGSSGGFGR